MINTILPFEWFVKNAVKAYLNQNNLEPKNIIIRRCDDFGRDGFDIRYEIKNKDQK